MPRKIRKTKKSVAMQPGKRKTLNSIKTMSRNLIENTRRFVSSEEFIPLTSVIEDRSGGNSKKRPKKDNLTMVIDDDALNVDFIPLSCPETSGKKQAKKSLSSKVNDNSVSSSTEIANPPTIVIDEDDDDVCSVMEYSDDENSVVNDSIEIIAENAGRKRSNQQLKNDDCIEICLDTCDVAKRRKVLPSYNNSIVENLRTLPGPSIDKNESDNDDIVILDVDDKKDSVVILDIPQTTNLSVISNKKKKKKGSKRKSSDQVNSCNQTTNVTTPFAFEDTTGMPMQNRAKYKSPLASVGNSSLDGNETYCNSVGNNIYNPNRVEKTGLRPVIIDGSNVAYGHGGNVFSTRGLEICCNYFIQRGHWVVAFVPLFRRSEVSEHERKILDDLQSKGILKFTPSRFLHGRRLASYDDRFIVQCAAEVGGVVVSTDNYRDLVQENEAWRETIEKRLLMFTWVGDILMFPDDPCGRRGPRLEEFLRFPS